MHTRPYHAHPSQNQYAPQSVIAVGITKLYYTDVNKKKTLQSHLTCRISKAIICNSFRNLPYLLITFAQSKEQT